MNKHNNRESLSPSNGGQGGSLEESMSREFSSDSSMNQESPFIKQNVSSSSDLQTKQPITTLVSKDSGIQMVDSNDEFNEESPLSNPRIDRKEDLAIVKAKKGRLRCNFTIGEAITFSAWLIVITFVTWYIFNSIENYIISLAHPTTSLSYVESLPLYYPAVTVCNWNADIDCDYCNLTLMYATSVNQEYGTIEEFDFAYTNTEIEQSGQYFTCYVFNNDTQNLLAANNTGYGGTISLFFKVPLVPVERDARFGLQVSFHEPGTVPPVFAETNFAVSKVDNFFILTKFVTTRLKPTVDDPSLVSVRWESKLSVVKLTEVERDVVVISFAYSTLNENRVTEVLTSSIESLLGEISGMVGMISISIFSHAYSNKKLHQQQEFSSEDNDYTPPGGTNAPSIPDQQQQQPSIPDQTVIPSQPNETAPEMAPPGIRCSNRPSNSPQVCSGKGSCIAQDVCVCNSSEWFGADCELSVSSFRPSSFRVDYYRTVLIEGLEQGPSVFVNYREGRNRNLSLNFAFSLMNGSFIVEDEFNTTDTSNAFYQNTKILSTGSYSVGVNVFVYGRLIFSSTSRVLVVSANNPTITQQELDEFSIVNVRDLLINVGSLNNRQVKDAINSLRGKQKSDSNDFVNVASSFLIASQRQQSKRPTSIEEDDLLVTISEGLLNFSNPLLEQVKSNQINDTTILKDMAGDILNTSSILITSGLSDGATSLIRNSHNSNIRRTIYFSSSLLSLVRSLNRTIARIKIENSAFNMIVSNETNIELGETKIQVPFSLLSENVDFSLISYSNGIDFGMKNNSELKSAANIIELRRLVDGDYTPLSNLQIPLVLTFPIFNISESPPFLDSGNFTQNFTCRYYNTTTMEWLTNGCTLVSTIENSIVCSCDHTTSFSAFVEYYPIYRNPSTNPTNPTDPTNPTNPTDPTNPTNPTNQTNPNIPNPTIPTNSALKALDSGLVIFKIVVSSILLLLVVSVMTGLVIFRKMQPVKSRYIFPFVGLLALFVDLIFTGIASKAATINVPMDELATRNSTPNIINSVSLIVTTSLTAVAICSYMIVCIRYIMYRHYYQWMSLAISQKAEKTTSKGIRLLKNNAILLGSLLVLGLSIVAYFVLLVVLRRTDQMNSNQFSYSTSISHFLIMIGFMVMIGIVFLVDLIMDFRNKQISDDLYDISNEISSTQNSPSTPTNTSKKDTAFVASVKLKQLFGKNSTPSKLYHYLLTNDRLLFRLEASVYVIGMLFFIASYIIGFYTLEIRYGSILTEAQAYQLLILDSVSYVFEIFMNLAFILVFGGLAVISSITMKFKRSPTLKKDDGYSMEKSLYGEIFSVLESKHLMKLFKAFCKNEFSLENLSLFLNIYQLKKEHKWLQEQQVPKESTSTTTLNTDQSVWNDFKKEYSRWNSVYLDDSSDMAVNISANTKKAYLYYLDMVNSNSIAPTSDNLSDLIKVVYDLEMELLYNLLDTYSRFCTSEPFKLLKRIDSEKELLLNAFVDKPQDDSIN